MARWQACGTPYWAVADRIFKRGLLMTEQNRQDEQMNSGLSVAERDLLQARLGELDDTMPPREVWQRIAAQARAEGLFRQRFAEGTKWLAGTGIAAAVVLAVLNIPAGTPVIDDGSEVFDATPPVSVATDDTTVADLNALMVQSQQIERDLRALPGRPSLMRAGTAVTISDLEDQVAAIDYWLNHPQAQLTPGEEAIYWRERVRLMNTLLNLRAAQAQRVSF